LKGVLKAARDWPHLCFKKLANCGPSLHWKEPSCVGLLWASSSSALCYSFGFLPVISSSASSSSRPSLSSEQPNTEPLPLPKRLAPRGLGAPTTRSRRAQLLTGALAGRPSQSLAGPQLGRPPLLPQGALRETVFARLSGRASFCGERRTARS